MEPGGHHCAGKARGGNWRGRHRRRDARLLYDQRQGAGGFLYRRGEKRPGGFPGVHVRHQAECGQRSEQGCLSGRCQPVSQCAGREVQLPRFHPAPGADDGQRRNV